MTNPFAGKQAYVGGRESVTPTRRVCLRVRVSVTPLAREGSENDVPQRRGDAVAVPVVLEVVTHVLLANALAQVGSRLVMVHVVVRVVICEIADDESREDGIGRRGAEDQGVD